MAGVSWEVLKACLENATDFAPQKVVSAADYEAEFMAEWFDHVLEPGLELPFGFPWRIRSSETTIWTGVEKSGKTTLLSYILMGLLYQGERALVASFEVKPVKTLKKYSRQAFGGLLYDRKFVERCESQAHRDNYRAQAEESARETLRWLGKNLFIYDHVGIAHWREVLDDMRWARRRYGITQFVLDNFMRLGIAKDDYTQQADAMTAIAAFAMDCDCHVHVVVHQNKAEGKGNADGKRSVAGAYEIIANAHNIVEVQRDVNKGKKVSELFQDLEIGKIGQTEFNIEKGKLDLIPDGKFILHAQRDGEEQNGSKYLWFLWESQQYVDVPPSHKDHRPIRFVDAARKAEERERQAELPTSEELGL